MAHTNFIDPVASMSGSIVRREGVYFRTRNGKTHAYRVTRPYEGPCSEAQSSMRQNFGACVREASRILKDDTLRADWEARYAAHLTMAKRYPAKYPHPCSTLRGFIISTLHKGE